MSHCRKVVTSLDTYDLNVAQAIDSSDANPVLRRSRINQHHLLLRLPVSEYREGRRLSLSFFSLLRESSFPRAFDICLLKILASSTIMKDIRTGPTCSLAADRCGDLDARLVLDMAVSLIRFLFLGYVEK